MHPSSPCSDLGVFLNVLFASQNRQGDAGPDLVWYAGLDAGHWMMPFDPKGCRSFDRALGLPKGGLSELGVRVSDNMSHRLLESRRALSQ